MWSVTQRENEEGSVRKGVQSACLESWNASCCAGSVKVFPTRTVAGHLALLRIINSLLCKYRISECELSYRACQENYEDSQRTFIGCDKLHLSRKKHDGFSSENSFNALDTARSTAEIRSHIYIQICHAVLNRTQSLLALAYMVFILWVIGGRAWFCKFRRWCRLWCCEMCGSDSTQDICGIFNHLREKQMWDT